MKNFLLILILSFLASNVSGQIVNIPDTNLKNALLSHDPIIDTNGDSEIQYSEAATVTALNLYYKSISDPTGVEAFANVTIIELSGNNLTAVDFSQLTNLQELYLSNNDFSNITSSLFPSSLTILGMEMNNLQSVNLSGLPNLNVLYLAENNITSVNVSTLSNLETLYLSNNQVGSLNSADLPNSLLELFLNSNLLNENTINLNTLTNLKLLVLSSNNFTAFDGTNFPASLEKLYLRSNTFPNETSLSLSSLINLKALRLGNNNFSTFLGTNLPANLEVLRLGSNNLDAFVASTFPNLKELDVSHNNFNSLDASWTNLEILDISNNNFSTADLSAYTNLLTLDISNNNLSAIDVSNSPNLQELWAADNNLSSVTTGNLSNLNTLWLLNNQLITLDLSQFPNLVVCGLSGNLFTELDFSSNPLIGGDFSLTNLPNLEYLNLKTGMTPELFYLMGVPNLQAICVDDVAFYSPLVNSTWWDFNGTLTTYCSFTPGQYNTITGNIKRDTGAGCGDASAVPLDNVLVKTVDNATSTTSSATFTDNLGHYSLFVGQGTFTTSSQINLPTYYVASPASHSSTFANFGNTDQADFCVQATQAVDDLNVTILPINQARPGFDAEYKIIYENIGTTSLSGQIVFQFDGNLQNFVSASPTETSSTTNSLTFDYSNLLPFQTREIMVAMYTEQPPTVNSGDILNFTASITPNSNDNTPNDNTFLLEQLVVNSYDPNDKQVLEGGEIEIADADEYLHYVIRFQNKGTASAINVVATDTLSDKLNWNSIRMLSASHDYHVQITNGSFVEFIFEGINLPHEAADEPGSHGYVAFKIKPKDNIAIGDIIEGKAAIYFDYNAPIITNTVSTEIMNLSTENFEQNEVHLYPNPTDGILNISSATELKKVEIYSLTGNSLFTQKTNLEKINFQSLATGIYFIKITNENDMELVEKIVKK